MRNLPYRIASYCNIVSSKALSTNQAKNYRNMLEISIFFYPICTWMTFDLKMWHGLRGHICLVCFASVLGVFFFGCLWKDLDQQLLGSDGFNGYIFILHSFDLWPFPDLASIRAVVGAHREVQSAWMPHSTQFCHQKSVFMEWTAN